MHECIQMICGIVGSWNIYNQNVVTPKPISLLSVSNKISSVFITHLEEETVFLTFVQGRPIDVVYG